MKLAAHEPPSAPVGALSCQMTSTMVEVSGVDWGEPFDIAENGTLTVVVPGTTGANGP